MASLKDVKNRINSVNSTQQITKAMKMVAASKLRKAQDKITFIRPFTKKVNSLLSEVHQYIDNDELIGKKLTEIRPINKALIIVISSDKGLCGAFNSNILKKTVELVETKYASLNQRGDLSILTIGKRANDFFVKRNYKTISSYHGLMHKLYFDQALSVADYIIENFIKHEFDEVMIVYNEFKNIAVQNLMCEKLLPFEIKDDKIEDNTQYIFEPKPEILYEELISELIKLTFYKACLESNAAEQGARMSAMDKASDNARELLKELKLAYNRTRQAAITKEILEIVGGAEALSKGA